MSKDCGHSDSKADRQGSHIRKLQEENVELRKCKEALEAMAKCPLIIEAGFVPYIKGVLGLTKETKK